MHKKNTLCYFTFNEFLQRYTFVRIIIFLGLILLVNANAQDSELNPGDLKKMSIEELMDIEITSVSKTPEKLSETPSAVQVITNEDIRRSGAKSLPEALRLASNLVVAQIDARQWAVSARGFNSSTANKLLVLIDGRTVYTPLYSGVFWDVQDVLLEDIDRIEVISGPGATQWGSNAVNGVINITTRNAKMVQGFQVSAGGGTEINKFGNIRYGGLIDTNLYYKVYGKFFTMDQTKLVTGGNASDNWETKQGGFRIDWDYDVNDFTFQGDIYDGKIKQFESSDIKVNGGNLLSRWSHSYSQESSFMLQMYFDRTYRDIPGTLIEKLNTYDLDFQYRIRLGNRHDMVSGLGYRLFEDDIKNSSFAAFLPAKVSRELYNIFLQDKIMLISDILYLSVGCKIEHNDYTGYEFQPNGRLAWAIDQNQILWTAVSRAVRTPSRIDREFFSPGSQPFLLEGGPDFVSEELLAYELGYRVQPTSKISLSFATYYNIYNKIRSVERVNPATEYPLVIANGQEGESYGAELTVNYQINEWWRLWAGYTGQNIQIRRRIDEVTTINSTESNDPEHQFFCRSWIDLTKSLELNTIFRWIDKIDPMSVPAYTQIDLQVTWYPVSTLELSITGQNLLNNRHAEFGYRSSRSEIERGIYGKIVWHY